MKAHIIRTVLEIIALQQWFNYLITSSRHFPILQLPADSVSVSVSVSGSVSGSVSVSVSVSVSGSALGSVGASVGSGSFITD